MYLNGLKRKEIRYENRRSKIKEGNHILIYTYLTKLVMPGLISPLVEGVEDVEWSAVAEAVKRQYVRV